MSTAICRDNSSFSAEIALDEFAVDPSGGGPGPTPGVSGFFELAILRYARIAQSASGAEESLVHLCLL